MNRRHFLALSALAPTAAAQEPAEDRFAPLKALLAASDPAVWLFTGDSITHGAAHTNGWRSYPEHFNERVKFELRRYRDVVINTGISGDRMPSLLKDLEWRALRYQPTVVSLMMGMNDCGRGPAGIDDFRTNLGLFHDAVKAKGSHLLMNTPNAVHIPNSAARKHLPLYVDAIRAFSEERRLPLVDHFKFWTETRKGPFDLIYVLRDAAVHPNNYGHILLAKLIFRELGIDDPASATCRLWVP